ncbi:unnamed protein product [Cutaneotrichosporon oleaginosum]
MAPLLPMASPSPAFDDGFLPRSDRGLPIMLRRMTKFKTMDFELAFWQLTYLVVAPRRVYKQTYHHKQTKNVWARDDPAMLILIAACCIATASVWGFMYGYGTAGTVWLILKMVFRDFILVSLAVALVFWLIANRLMVMTSAHSGITDNRVEFTYAWDVAVNSFFPAFLTLYVGLLPLAALVVKNNWVCLLLGNTLFLIAGFQYIYITYLGYAALPFVARSELFLAPLLPLLGGYLLSLLGFNIVRTALELYFGEPWHN